MLQTRAIAAHGASATSLTWVTHEGTHVLLDGVSLEAIRDLVGTPCYVYSKRGFENTIKWFTSHFSSGSVSFKYAVKACPSVPVIKLFGEAGFGGNIVTMGELYACIQAGIEPNKIAYAGVGKTRRELEEVACMGIGYICAESEWELAALSELKAKLTNTRILVRTNLNIEAATHPYLSTGREENKFGIADRIVMAQYREWQKTLPVVGLQLHIGSQILDMRAFREAADAIVSLANALRTAGARVDVLDFGGGVGVRYDCDDVTEIHGYATIVTRLVDRLSVEIILEPGRLLTAKNGVIVGSVLYHKSGLTKDFIITDISMSDNIRPALYNAQHRFIADFDGTRMVGDKPVDIVGPLCEAGDFLGLGRRIEKLREGDFIVMLDTGAYGFAMASNYNSRAKPPEIMVDDGTIAVLRHRQQLSEFI